MAYRKLETSFQQKHMFLNPQYNEQFKNTRTQTRMHVQATSAETKIYGLQLI